MKVGDLVKHINFEKYGIVTEILEFHSHAPLYYVVLWWCGNRSGQYGKLLEAVCE